MGIYVFGKTPPTSCVLSVPEGTIFEYKLTDQWKDFKNIVEIQPGAIDDINADIKEGKASYYNLNGVQVMGDITPGIYIEVRNGKARKVQVK